MFKNYMSIVMGTENITIYLKNYDTIFTERSLLAYNIKDKKITAVGNEAQDLIGKENKNIKIFKLISEGVINDRNVTEQALKVIFKKRKLLKLLKHSLVVLGGQTETDKVEYDPLKKIIVKLGGKTVHVVNSVKMAAVGAGINISSHSGNLVVDIGAGTTDIAIIASGDIVVSKSIKVAGNHITQEIQKYLKTYHNVEIGELTSENLKKNLSTLNKNAPEVTLNVHGRSINNGMPIETTIANSEIYKIITPYFEKIADAIKEVLSMTEPELVGDIYKNGIILTGGTSLIPGINKFISTLLNNIDVTIAQNPIACVIEGTKLWESNIIKEFLLRA